MYILCVHGGTYLQSSLHVAHGHHGSLGGEHPASRVQRRAGGQAVIDHFGHATLYQLHREMYRVAGHDIKVWTQWSKIHAPTESETVH